MADDWGFYIVNSGDHLEKIAARLGFDPAAVWADARNEALRAKRASGNVLYPGDVLLVPPVKRKWLPVRVGEVNHFTARVRKITLTVVFTDGGEPMAGVRCAIGELPALGELRTDGDGTLRFAVPASTDRVTVEFPDHGYAQPLLVGDLNPTATRSGMTQRLKNLGFLSDDPDPHGYRDDHEALGPAILRFQGARGDGFTVAVDEAVRAAVEDAHGC